MTRRPTSLTRTPAVFAPCEGAGIRVDETRAYWGNSICPACGGIAQLEDDGSTIASHDVRMIDFDDCDDDE